MEVFIPDRILILGPPRSGKTTFAAKLGLLLPDHYPYSADWHLIVLKHLEKMESQGMAMMEDLEELAQYIAEGCAGYKFLETVLDTPRYANPELIIHFQGCSDDLAIPRHAGLRGRCKKLWLRNLDKIHNAGIPVLFLPWEPPA